MKTTAITGLKPESLWQRFYEITQVPRPSKKEGKILAYLKNIAEELNIEYVQDKVGNIVMRVPATPGYENSPTVVLQGHVDMVCEKNKTKQHDFDNDPITILRDGDWITADGTTLGSDNGIGVAAGLAIATDKDAIHGPLEILLTIDEETGLTGVKSLKPGFITGNILLNLDSEEDGAFYVGCAGGQDTIGILPIDWVPIKKEMKPYLIRIEGEKGLKGGHSGLDIHKNRGNSIQLITELVKKMEGCSISYQIYSISGGSARNAIPREAEVGITINPSDESGIQEIIKNFVDKKLPILKETDEDLVISFTPSSKNITMAFSDEFELAFFDVLRQLPHGVVKMSPDIGNLVETSTNLAVIKIIEDSIVITTNQRSFVDADKKQLSGLIKSVFKAINTEFKEGDSYPGWKPNMDSKLLKTCKNVYKENFGKEPEVKAIHAGLETAILGEKYPGLDMISFGPTIEGAHSPDERVNIADVEKFYTLLKGILTALAGTKS